MTITRKVEQAFYDFLKVNPSTSSEFIFQGHGNERLDYPCIICAAESADERDDIPPGSGHYTVKVSIFVLMNGKENTLEMYDDLMERVNNALLERAEDGTQAIEGLNLSPLIHVFACHYTGEKSVKDDQHWGNALSFEAVVTDRGL